MWPASKGAPLSTARQGASARRLKADAFAARVLPTLQGMQHDGMSLHRMAAELTARGVRTSQNGAWTATAVRRVLARAGEPSAHP
jgi:hypothetical protein